MIIYIYNSFIYCIYVVFILIVTLLYLPIGSTGAAASEEIESDDDDEMPIMGFQGILQEYSGNPQKKEKAPKAKGKAKAHAKVAAHPKAPSVPPPSTTAMPPPPTVPAKRPAEGQPATHVQPPKTPKKVDQVGIGRLGGNGTANKGRGKKRTAPADDLDLDNPVDPQSFQSLTGLSETDSLVMESFEGKFEPLKVLSDCPLPDHAFRAYLMEKQNGITALGVELKTKKKTVHRRAGKDHDPLYIALSDFGECLSSLSHLIKCYLACLEHVTLHFTLYTFMFFISPNELDIWCLSIN